MKTQNQIPDIKWQKYTILETELGARLSTKEVAAYMGLDEDTVRKYYKKLGGIRLTGPKGRILFFERNMVSALSRRTEYAFEHNEEWTNSMEGKSAEGWGNQTETSQNQKGGTGLGGKGKKTGLVGEDRHGILDG